MTNRAYIKGIASYLPPEKLTNDDLIKDYPDWDVQKIYNKTGISTRAIAGKNECASDLAVAAAERLFAKGICKREEIEFLILCTQSPDYYLPTTACIVQDRLKLPTTCGAFDINLGCSGYVYGLSVVKGMIESGIINNALLITSETYSKYLHPSDRSVRTIFSDGAAATFVSSIESEEELIGPFVFGTDGSGYDLLIVHAGGLRTPISQETGTEQTFDDGISRSPQNLFMDGAEIFNFTLKSVPATVEELLKKSKMTIDCIDMYIFHQANAFMLETLRRKMKIPKEKFCINNEHYGNTVSSTIPMAIEQEVEKGNVKKGDKLMLVGFGVGLSWAGTVMKYV